MTEIDGKMLDRLKKAIESGMLHKSDKYHKVNLDYPITIDRYESGCIVRATNISDSSIWLKVYETAGLNDDPRAFLNAVDAENASTKYAWKMLAEQPDATVNDMMVRFNIRASIHQVTKTPLLKEKDAQAVAELLAEWGAVRCLLDDQECYNNDSLTFMRETRRKKADESERPGCFDGLCIDRMLVNKLPNVRDAAW